MEEPVVFFHGFSKDVLFKIVDAVKKTASEEGIDPSSIAFASSTVNNMEWKIRKLIREVRKEHDTLARKAPPGTPAEAESRRFPSGKDRVV